MEDFLFWVRLQSKIIPLFKNTVSCNSTQANLAHNQFEMQQKWMNSQVGALTTYKFNLIELIIVLRNWSNNKAINMLRNVLVSSLTRNQEQIFRTVIGNEEVTTAIIARLSSPIQAPAPRVLSNINNTMPNFVPEDDWEVTVNWATVILLTQANLKNLFVRELSLSPKHINILCEEGITHQ